MKNSSDIPSTDQGAVASRPKVYYRRDGQPVIAFNEGAGLVSLHKLHLVPPLPDLVEAFARVRENLAEALSPTVGAEAIAGLLDGLDDCIERLKQERDQ